MTCRFLPVTYRSFLTVEGGRLWEAQQQAYILWIIDGGACLELGHQDWEWLQRTYERSTSFTLLISHDSSTLPARLAAQVWVLYVCAGVYTHLGVSACVRACACKHIYIIHNLSREHESQNPEP